MNYEKCPLCGVEMMLEPAMGDNSAFHKMSGRSCLINQIKQKNDIISQLPIFEDTGEPFVPNLNKCFILCSNGRVLASDNPLNIGLRGNEEIRCITKMGAYVGKHWYSLGSIRYFSNPAQAHEAHKLAVKAGTATK